MAPPARECQLCGKPAPLACPGCGAVFYCNEAHRRRHAAQLGHDADECGRWAAAAAPERRQAPCLLSSMPPTAMPPTSWAAYYRLRGLPPDSPAALLLDATLTLYSAVLRVHRQLAALQQASGDASQQQACGIVVSPSNPGGSSGGSSGSVAPKLARQRGTPHAVVAPNAGLAAYMSWLPTLQLLLEQLQSPGGGGSSSSPSAADCGQNTRESSNLRAGANAGQAVGVAGPLVCCFTDYNSEAVHRSRQLLDYLLASQAATSSGSGGAGSRGVGPDGRSAQPGSGCAAGGLVVQEGLNPFRKPAAVLATDNALPAASNGFALWLERPVVR
ncbi:zinc finger MYND domain-containing 15-like [Chlorella sorokiniana]|uniref:Zinc finger MYND domain-containing 15-like n=1 Tax=Chlorella sorokiniana TaxID=3076 RepID=A0A2P6TNN7_CHLSO|nr:zinc finger MYND domain-containing 15-like [Chlorella sorokiniana]|eukprot:PRW50948.1 zinc finger MYND domain-containing 15-like [Chlorella sorokiniana]